MGKQYTKKERRKFIDVLRAKDGHIGKACIAFGINRSTYYDWLEEDWFAQEVTDMHEGEIDDAEEMLRVLRKGVPMYERDKKGAIKTGPDGKPIVIGWLVKPDPKSVRFFLERKGADRGFGRVSNLNIGLSGMMDNVQIGLKVHKKTKTNGKKGKGS